MTVLCSGDSAYPQPPVGAVLVDTAANDGTGKVWGRASANYRQEAVRTCLEEAGLEITPLREWLVAWPASSTLRDALKTSTLYITLEPSKERQGQALPSVTQLIQQSGVRRVVIGCTDPVPEKAGKGAAALHASGLQVRLLCVTSSSLSSSMALLSSSSGASDDNDNNHGSASGSGETASIYQLQHDCQELIRDYSHLANSKLHIQARKHYQLFGRPLGFLHCSVVDSDNLEAFARHGNAFGTKFGGKTLSFRNFGAYEIAPPPEVIWVNDDTASMMTSMDDYDALDVDSEDEDYDNDLDDNLISVDFEDEDYQGDIAASPMMPWYEQVNAVVATFPRPGNGPANDASISARLNGLKWLVSQGRQLPQGVERILVMDATDLKDLPLTNAQFAQVLGLSSSSSSGVGAGGLLDVESFWRADDRKPTRVLLRRGAHAQARAAAEAAAVAAQAAANAAMEAAEALESGDAARAAEAALDLERVARAETEYIQTQLQTLQTLRGRLEDLGVIVETINGGEPVDVMKHLGDRNGYQTVVWRAGCWGDRGVKSILAGAFQWVSAHLAVDAVGGKFWQLMLAENAVQAACGPVSKVKVFADQEDISLEYCDNPNVDTDCNLTIDGRPVRHIRLDCRIALVDENRPREFVIAKTKKIDRKIIEEEAPWFL